MKLCIRSVPSKQQSETAPCDPAAMINAVLVFNNAGQPRLTKFYSQLVRGGTDSCGPR